jgi:hypothetical protein
MIRRLVMLAMVACWCFGLPAAAADLPVLKAKHKLHRVVVIAKPKVIAAKPKSTIAKPKKQIAKARPIVSATAPEVEQGVASAPVAPDATGNEIDMAWVLDPLVATADGRKREGSASIEGNLIVAEPGYVTAPYMIIQLSGHIVKSPQTTARLDVNIAGTQRSVSWNSDDVQSGRFSIELKAPMQKGKLPDYFPVSALAFVTRDKDAGATMVSLDKIVVRVGKVELVATQ